jgi:hypothetical protein
MSGNLLNYTKLNINSRIKRELKAVRSKKGRSQYPALLARILRSSLYAGKLQSAALVAIFFGDRGNRNSEARGALSRPRSFDQWV